jgi:hypothetical protein
LKQSCYSKNRKTNADTISLKANINNPTFTGTVVTTAIKVTGGTIAAGKVLTSDADGLASWQAVSAVVREIGDEFIAVGPTSSFRLSSIPSQNNIVKCISGLELVIRLIRMLIVMVLLNLIIQLKMVGTLSLWIESRLLL